jgi:hydroxymethylpyrimidine pyrophosphatase-like HAD family hydrolase/adenine/guanine phosphoribosyltransferase-like PRPP-binding protein
MPDRATVDQLSCGSSAAAAPFPSGGSPGLQVTDLLMTAERMMPALSRCIASRDWLDAFLLSAGLLQLVEDRMHDDPLQLRRAAVYLRSRSSPPRHWAGTLAETAATGGRLLERPSTTAALTAARRATARLTLQLAAAVQDSRHRVDRAGIDRMLTGVVQVPTLVGDDVVRIPACFRDFDLHPDDMDWLGRKLLAERVLEAEPTCVVGVRTSGSYLAPLLVASLRARGVRHVELLTHRPGQRWRRFERNVLRAIGSAGGTVVIVDDPPVTGRSVAATADAVTAAGVPAARVVLALPLAAETDTVPPFLRGRPSVLQPRSALTVHRHLDADHVAGELARLRPRWRVDACRRRAEPTGPAPRGHLSGRYSVDVTDRVTGRPERIDLVVEGAGSGYLGRRAVAVAEQLPDWVPQVFGFSDGLLYRAGLPQLPGSVDEATYADRVAGYLAARRTRLPAAEDLTPRLSGRGPAWEVVARELSRLFGPLAPVAQATVVGPLVSALLRSPRPSVVDGATMSRPWYTDPSRPGAVLTVDFHAGAFSHLETYSYDPVSDLASALGTAPSATLARRLRASYSRFTGDEVDDQRWLLYRLAQAFRALRAGEVDPARAGDLCADAVHEYLAGHYLAAAPPPMSGAPLCAVDLDGVLETDRLGYPAAGPAGVLALAARRTHGYAPVLATGRSLGDVRDRCAAFGLVGGVAEYGAAVYDARDGTVEDLRSTEERLLLERVRSGLGQAGYDVDTRHRYCVRARLNGRRLPEDAVLAVPLLTDPRLHVVHGQSQTDVTVGRLDKAEGLRALALRLDGAEVVLAVGDSAADLPMLSMARIARAPRNADAAVRAAGVRLTRRAYRLGLLDACADLLGHAPGRCPACRPPSAAERAGAILTLLALHDGGVRTVPAQSLRVAVRGARDIVDSLRGRQPPAYRGGRVDHRPLRG